LRVFIAPLGFHEDSVLRMLVHYRASPGDRLVAVTCSPLAPGSRRAFESLRAQCLRQGLPEPLLVEVSCSRFYEAFPALLRQLRALGEPEEAVLEVGTGPRILGHLASLVLERLGWRYTIHYEPETGLDQPVEVPWGFIEAVKLRLSKPEEALLRLAVSRPGVTVAEAARETGWSEKTVRNIASRLRGKGLLEKRGRSEALEPTPYAVALYSV
jgi:CRISPR locus-related DNA-binding protein